MTHDELAALEAHSIREFVGSAADEGYLRGRVLDYGCGNGPYRRIIEEHGGHYDGYDEPGFCGSMVKRAVGSDLLWDANAWDAILCTQVIQYVDRPHAFLDVLRSRLFTGGHLVLTYPTSWPEIREDLWRFTEFGMERLLLSVGFEIVTSQKRGVIAENGFELPIGYGVVARR